MHAVTAATARRMSARCSSSSARISGPVRSSCRMIIGRNRNESPAVDALGGLPQQCPVRVGHDRPRPLCATTSDKPTGDHHEQEMRSIAVAVAGLGLLASCATTPPGPANMTFFVTSAGPGKGANLGGLAGADAHCQSLAARRRRGRAARGARTSARRRRRSTTRISSTRAIASARGRGATPRASWSRRAWPTCTRRAATSTRHGDRREGRPVNGRTDQPNNHDMLTGSRPDGTAFPARRSAT